MPHWDFKCNRCGYVVDVSFGSFVEMESVMNGHPCTSGGCVGTFERCASAPRFNVKGFSEVNGYASPIDVTMRKHGMKIQMKGNPEILRDGTGR